MELVSFGDALQKTLNPTAQGNESHRHSQSQSQPKQDGGSPKSSSLTVVFHTLSTVFEKDSSLFPSNHSSNEMVTFRKRRLILVSTVHIVRTIYLFLKPILKKCFFSNFATAAVERNIDIYNILLLECPTLPKT